ncbi:kinase-like protein [Delitschia confertaspora ATCC 74209]|uniref:Kinase-like protein n=1 Tax=Delitschia confertaspora ATCC 74209 TaxID=1513339 RepID=A0A9P4JRC3_9PLEO|nr:kinase-like protein [Delitschia confertaspora ATCC 74209]
MASKTLTNVVNDQTIAMNAMIYGYAGHSLVTPQHALQEIWWTDERINQKVTTDFIRTRLKPDERERLDQPIGFGDLTDDTYMDWILERARRLFLCLEEVGMSSKIFRAVENSWDDDDLPLQMEDIYKLSLSSKKSDKINDQFFQTQFTFLLRELREGVHIDYAPNEVLPLEYVMGLPPAVSLQNWPRVHLPKKQNEVYVRRKFPLGNAECPDAFESDFIMDIESSKMVEHEHIAPVWASYTVKGTGYTLTNFVGQHTLKTFIDHRNPLQYQKLPKPERRYLLLGWLHCLADAVATMHQIGFCHSSIRPSNILIDEQNHIAFSDIGSLETFQKDKRPDLTEVYNYTAPELQTTTTQTMTTTIDINPKSPIIPPSGRQPSIMSKSSSSSEKSSRSKKLTKSGSPKPTSDFSGFSFGLRRTKRPKIRQPPRTDGTEKADIFSLGCVMLDVLTFMLKKKAHDFVKHRSTKVDKQKAKETPALAATKSRTDSSFHANHEKVESWMKTLENATFGQEDDAFRAVPHILDLVRAMLQPSPLSRPSAREVRDRLLDILRTFISGMEEVHCAAHTHDIGIASSHSGSGSDRGISRLFYCLRIEGNEKKVRGEGLGNGGGRKKGIRPKRRCIE